MTALFNIGLLLVGGLIGAALMTIIVFDRFDDSDDIDTSRLDRLSEHGLSVTCLDDPKDGRLWGVLNGGSVVGQLDSDLRTAIDGALEAIDG